MLSYLLLGAGIGFVAGVSPGPVLTLVVAETLRGGWVRGAAVAAGPLLADGPVILLALSVVSQLPPLMVQVISLAGGAFLLYLALTTYLGSRQARVSRSRRLAVSGGLLKGLLARILSPNPYLFWFLVGAPLLLEAGRAGWASAPAFLLGYYLTIIGSNVVLALALHRCAYLFNDRVYRAVLLAGSAFLALYGLGLVGRSVGQQSQW